MPKPHGWTDAELRKRDSMVEAIQKAHSGISKSRAYAIATATVKRHKKAKVA